MSTTKPPRIGQKMRRAAEYVAEHPGCTKLAVAEHVGAHGSRMYGYQIVDRALAAGLIHTGPTSSMSKYALYVS